MHSTDKAHTFVRKGMAKHLESELHKRALAAAEELRAQETPLIPAVVQDIDTSLQLTLPELDLADDAPDGFSDPEQLEVYTEIEGRIYNHTGEEIEFSAGIDPVLAAKQAADHAEHEFFQRAEDFSHYNAEDLGRAFFEGLSEAEFLDCDDDATVPNNLYNDRGMIA